MSYHNWLRQEQIDEDKRKVSANYYHVYSFMIYNKKFTALFQVLKHAYLQQKKGNRCTQTQLVYKVYAFLNYFLSTWSISSRQKQDKMQDHNPLLPFIIRFGNNFLLSTSSAMYWTTAW